MTAKLNKLYNSMHKDYLYQCPLNILQKHIWLNSADAQFGYRMTVGAVCADSHSQLIVGESRQVFHGSGVCYSMVNRHIPSLSY